jgi:MFS family permease
MKITDISTFRSFRNKNFRLFFSGQGVSLIGTWMQQLAMSWLIYSITGSSFMLGVVSFCSMLPSLFLFPLTGIAADMPYKRTMLIITQSLAMLQALVLAALVITGTVAVWHIIVLSVFLGIVNAFDMPLRQAFVIRTIDHKEDLGNAIALNSSLFNSARLIGPTIAGILISVIGEGYCFLLNGISYLAVIFSLFRMKFIIPSHDKPGKHPLKDISEGIKYTFGFFPIRMTIIFLVFINLAGIPSMVLMPVFAKSVLGGDAHTLGLMTGASGFAAFVGTLYLASRKSIRGLGIYIIFAGFIYSIGLFIFSFSKSLPFSLFALLITGFTMMTIMAANNTFLQTIVKDSMRGRVMSFYVLSFTGISPFASLAVGSLSEKYSPEIVVFSSGILVLLATVFMAIFHTKIKKMIRPIYAEKGIISGILNAADIASGIQNADSITILQKK